MEILNIDGSDRKRKYPVSVEISSVDEKDKTGGKITVRENDSQKLTGGNERIRIVISESKTSIEFSNRKLISPVLNILKREQNKFPWKAIHQQSKITTRTKLTSLEIENLKDLIENTIRL